MRERYCAVVARHPAHESAMPSRPFARRAAVVALLSLTPLSLITRAAAAQTATIVVSDTVSVRFGFLSQTWADFSENVRQDSSVAQNIFLRRMRLMMAGQVGSHLTFFFQTDSPNLGRVGGGFNRSGSPALIIQDAILEVQPGSGSEFLLDAGLLYVPLCRSCSGNAALLLPLDFNSYTFLSTPLAGLSVGHDVGLMAKGYLNDRRIEYRIGAFSGARTSLAGVPPVATASNALRGAGRIAVQLLDPEAEVQAYPGTYFGKKRVLSVGVGADRQGDYAAVSADAFFSHPVGTDGVTASATFIRYDGGTFFAALPKQDTFEAEAGWHFNGPGVTPWLKVEGRRIDEAQKSIANQDETRLQVGATYYIAGHWANLKAAYTRATLERFGTSSLAQNGVTVQLQGFFF